MIKRNFLKSKCSNSHQYFSSERNFLKSKCSQITIFVVLAILIVVVLGIIFLVKPGFISPGLGVPQNPRTFIESCFMGSAEEYLSQNIEIGGLPNPSPSVEFDNKKVLLVCTTNKFEELCLNKHPALTSEIEKKMIETLKPKLVSCFNKLKNELSQYNFQEEALNFNVSITPLKVNFNIYKKISFTINGEIRTYENFGFKINSPFFNFLKIQNEILTQELDCDCEREACNADLVKLSLYYKDFQLDKPAFASAGEEVYSITEIISGKKMNFAIKNCVRKP